MNSKQELKVLNQINQLLIDEEQEIKKHSRKHAVINAVSWIAMVVAFMLVMIRGELMGMAAVAIAMISGMFNGLISAADTAVKQWSVIKPHIRNESIAARIKQLET